MPKQTPHVKRAIALTAALALTVSGITVHKGENAQAASKAPTLSASSVTLKKGQTKKIKIKGIFAVACLLSSTRYRRMRMVSILSANAT